MLFNQCLSLCVGGVSARFRFLELATGGGPFFFSKGGLTCCQGGRHFDLLWGRAINPSKNYPFRTVFLQFYVVLSLSYSNMFSCSNWVSPLLWRIWHPPLNWKCHWLKCHRFLWRICSPPPPNNNFVIITLFKHVCLHPDTVSSEFSPLLWRIWPPPP